MYYNILLNLQGRFMDDYTSVRIQREDHNKLKELHQYTGISLKRMLHNAIENYYDLQLSILKKGKK